MITKNRLLIAGIVLILVLLCSFLKNSLTTADVITNTIDQSTQSQYPSNQEKENSTSQIYIEC